MHSSVRRGVGDNWRLRRLERLWRPMEIHSSNGRREGDSKRLRETTETIETMESNGYALQCRKESK